MAGFFKKALGIFVEIEETPIDTTSEGPKKETKIPTPNAISVSGLNQLDIEKFEKHFDKLFEQSNMPGPDYYEFCKMLETLEAHIPDEKTRFSAVYASLSIQGLTKEKLLTAAEYYKKVISDDRQKFEHVIDKKAHTELETRKTTVTHLESKMTENSALIQKLTKEISDSQTKIAALKNEIAEEEKRLITNKSGYNLACDAMMNKINVDIQKIQSNL